jgi:hypothetical protein
MKWKLNSGSSRLFNLAILTVRLTNFKELSTLSKLQEIMNNLNSGINDTSFKSSDWKELETRLDSFKKSFDGFIEQLKKDK